MKNVVLRFAIDRTLPKNCSFIFHSEKASIKNLQYTGTEF